MIDTDGYRPNVGIIVINAETDKVLWARRHGQDAWQFPQGGIKHHETPEDALYRELDEELGLQRNHVEIIGATRGWLRYELPKRFIRRRSTPMCIGQKQVWFLLRFIDHDDSVKLDASTHPEFDRWKWVNYWHPAREVIYFKRDVYRRALRELAPLIYPNADSTKSREAVPRWNSDKPLPAFIEVAEPRHRGVLLSVSRHNIEMRVKM